MKRTTKLLALALALLLALGLAGCGAKTASMTDSCYGERISSAPMEEPRPDTPMESESMPSPASAPGGFGNLAAEDACAEFVSAFFCLHLADSPASAEAGAVQNSL